MVFQTVMNVWGTTQFGPIIREAWGNDPISRVGILFLAGIACACLTNVWEQILDTNPSAKEPQKSSAIPVRLDP